MQEAHSLGRKFIGIDESVEAIRLNKKWMSSSLYQYDFDIIHSLESNRIINEVSSINRVTCHTTSKPTRNN